MKRLLLMMLLLGGIVLSSQAQRYRDDYDGYRGRGHGYGHYKKWKRERCDDRYYGGYYREDCRPRRVVVYERPVYYAPPPPPPVVYYPSRPRVVVNAGISIIH